MDLIAALEQTFSHTHQVVAGVKKDQLSLATPCSEWTTGELISHTVGVVRNIGQAVATGNAPTEPSTVELSNNLGAQFRATADDTLAAWRKAGLDGETNIGAGPMPRQAAISINLLDTATHAWDIARATGQPEALPADLATLVFGICQGFVTDDVRKFAGFAPAVTVGASANPTEQLVAFLGRKP